MGNHWVTLSISTKYDQDWYCDSSILTDPITDDRLTHDWTDVVAVLNEYVPSSLYFLIVSSLHDNFMLTYKCFCLGLLTCMWLRCQEDTKKTNADSLNIILHSASNNKLQAIHALPCLLKHGCIWSTTELLCKCKCIYFTLLSMLMIKYAY
jgi:hypothetical protein